MEIKDIMPFLLMIPFWLAVIALSVVIGMYFYYHLAKMWKEILRDLKNL